MAAQADPAAKRTSSLTLRLISAAVLIPIVLLAAYFGFPWWNLLVIVFGGVMIWEWCSVSSQRRDSFGETLVTTVLIVLGLAALSFWSWSGFALPNLWLALIVGVLLTVLIAMPRQHLAGLWFGAGFIYVAIPCTAIITLRSDPTIGLQQILWVVALVIAADTGAYAAGRSIGGPKLAPRISPNKTWAGLIGAIVSAAVVGAIAATLLDKPSIWPLAALSGAVAIVEQAGDLAESAFKRHFGVKDSGHIIPGHGGALDRVDGLMAVAAAVAGLNYAIGSSVLTWL
ncbi:MAG TPA: phosphatidate cytidylyltransferase [Dongiaceae bacterium]|jgi:phosphatidate cytidylyltransferase